MNFKAEGGGVPMAPKADATDGKLSICSVHGIPKWRIFMPAVPRGGKAYGNPRI